MNSEEYLGEMRKIQQNILDLLDYEKNVEEKYQNLSDIFDEIKIHDNQYKIKSVMHLLLKICQNHHREEGFFSKIERILKLFKGDLQKYFSNSELFNTFKGNKRILLFLIEEKIITFDEFIAKRIIQNKYLEKKYPQYFQPEIQPFIKEKWFPKYDEKNDKLSNNIWVDEITKEIPADFYEKRKIGENDDFICKIIQKDLIDEFIAYVNKNEISIQSKIKNSIFETNSYLLSHKENSLIEYAAFFGSTQIFKYCLLNNSETMPSLWLYAIHDQNPEIICLLEERSIVPKYDNVIKEAIKCHHNEIVNYLLNDHKISENLILRYSMKYYNFKYFEIDINDMKIFYHLCKYDYALLVEYLIKNTSIDVNRRSKEVVKIKEKIVATSPFITKIYVPYANRRSKSDKIVQKAALHFAVEKENIEIIKLLLENENIDVNIKTSESFGDGRDPCDWDWSRQKYWIDYYGISTEKTALYIATELNNLEIVNLLLNCKSIDVNILSSERICIYYEDEDSDSYCKDRKDITTEKTALEIAVKNENSEIVQQLLNHKNIDVNIKSLKYGIELWVGWGGGNDDIITDKTVLHTAVKKQNAEIVKLLLSNENIDTNIKYCYRRIRYERHYGEYDDREKTALFLAVEKSNAEIVQLLLNNKNIDINLKSEFKNFLLEERNSDDLQEYHPYLFKRANKYYRTKWGFEQEEEEKGEEEEKEEEEKEKKEEHMYSPINTNHKKYMRFPKNVMTPLELANEQKNDAIIKLLSK